jgi:hypothetical protein
MTTFIKYERPFARNVRAYPSGKGECMPSQIKAGILVLALITVGFVSPLLGQQKGQWVPGQAGLDAGILPDPGLTYASLNVNYSANALNNSSGNKLPGITGTFSFWAIENVLYYVPKIKILGGKLAFMAALPAANGSLTADVGVPSLGIPPQFGLNGGGYGFADSWFQPLTLGWNLKRVDTFVAYAFTAPTGRYTPGASDNVGSGYWGNNLESNSTVYLTKNRGTTANLLADWEVHGQRNVASFPAGQVSHITPGQAFTIEWGIGQFLPLDKQMHKLLEFGLVGYDQWQISANGGTYLVAGLPVAASRVPYYSVHAVGFQTNLILPAKNLAFVFKYEPEYSAKARPQGRTIVFGGSYTFKFPKARPPKP